MKWKILKNRYFISGCTVAALLMAALLMISSRPLSKFAADIDGDGTNDTLKITRRPGSKFGKDLVIETSNGRFVYSMEELKPIKVQAADVDGDGKSEISVTVYKKTRLDSEYRKRPFFYNWHPEGLSPKWLGSALSRPFEDFIFADIDCDGAQELIAMEIADNDDMLINAYKWSGFGFSGIGQSEEFRSISAVEKGAFIKDMGYTIRAKIKKDNRWEWLELRFDGDKLAETETKIDD